MFERFTDRAKRVRVLAARQARALNHGYIGPEHLLLGLVEEGSGVASNVLNKCGVTLISAKRELITTVGPSTTSVEATPPAEDREGSRVFELAIEEARQLNHNYVGTEHLLLSLLRAEFANSLAHQVLTKLGVSGNKLREQVSLLLGVESDGSTVPPPNMSSLLASLADDLEGVSQRVRQIAAHLESSAPK